MLLPISFSQDERSTLLRCTVCNFTERRFASIISAECPSCGDAITGLFNQERIKEFEPVVELPYRRIKL